MIRLWNMYTYNLIYKHTIIIYTTIHLYVYMFMYINLNMICLEFNWICWYDFNIGLLRPTPGHLSLRWAIRLRICLGEVELTTVTTTITSFMVWVKDLYTGRRCKAKMSKEHPPSIWAAENKLNLGAKIEKRETLQVEAGFWKEVGRVFNRMRWNQQHLHEPAFISKVQFDMLHLC